MPRSPLYGKAIEADARASKSLPSSPTTSGRRATPPPMFCLVCDGPQLNASDALSPVSSGSLSSKSYDDMSKKEIKKFLAMGGGRSPRASDSKKRPSPRASFSCDRCSKDVDLI